MFPVSTQRKHWMLGNDANVNERKKISHENFISRFRTAASDVFLTFEETETLLRFFERKLFDFCVKFRPPMTKNVAGTALQYFKRFYLANSVMDYHPKEILVTAAYLACKVEEFNVTMEQFVSNINGNKERAQDIILNHELLLMSQLNFHLTVHNPWRPVEGMIIDMKTRLVPILSSQGLPIDPESFRPEIEKFLDDAVAFTSAPLIYAPSQIALAAVIHGASRNGCTLDNYVTDVLFGINDDASEKERAIQHTRIKNIIEAVRNIRVMVKNLPSIPSVSTVKTLCDRLERCRNQDNNPDSQAYKRKIQELMEDDDDRAAKLARYDSTLQ